jgi:aminoglycoside phosphotransferase (APT) family kinase protein
MNVGPIINAERGIDGVRWLLCAQEPQRAVRRELERLLLDGHTIASLLPHRTKYKPGRKLSAWYTAGVRDGHGADWGHREVAVTWTHDEPQMHPAAIAAIEREAWARGLAQPFFRLRGWAPEWQMQVLVAPMDTDLPGLVRIADPDELADLAAFSPHSVTTVRYRPGQRHVLRHGAGDSSLFAKISAKAEPRTAMARIRALADWMEALDSPVGVVRPLTARATDDAVLYRGIIGRTIPLHQRWMQRAGVALRQLHGAPPDMVPLPSVSLDTEVTAVGRAAQHIDALLPDTGPAFHAAVGRAADIAERLPEETPVVLHGDFKLDHVLITADGLTLIDLDRCRIGDPSLDIGKFLADVRWRCDGPGQTDRMQQAFLDGYAGAADAEAPHRALCYEALLLLKIAARRVPVTSPSWAARTAELVSKAGAIVTDLDAATGRKAPTAIGMK